MATTPGSDEDQPAVLAGRLLVATPVLTEGPFRRTVVLLLRHGDDEGALGVVLNRPSEADLADVLPDWERRASAPTVVFEGGPVQATAAICLGRLRPGAAPSPTYAVLRPGLATVDLDADPAEGLDVVRIFAGYAGWSSGQLEAEVAEGAWWVLDALPGDAFTAAPELLWRQVLRRQGMPLAMAASYPDDPSLN